MAEEEGEKSNEAELFERVVELAETLHDRELASAENLGGRAATLIGFSGVVLTLTASLAREAFGQGRDLGTFGNSASACLFLLAVGCLLASAVQAVRAASPREQDRVTEQPLDTYAVKKPPVEALNKHFGTKVIGVIGKVAKSNTDRGRTLQWAFRWLATGLILVAGQAAIMGVDRLTEVW